MTCENCENAHEGSYGSGRFCCAKCARGFSTKANRAATSAKASASLKGRRVGFAANNEPLEERICKTCAGNYKPRTQKQRYCSRSCGGQVAQARPARRNHQSEKRVQALRRGVTNGYSIRCTYPFRGEGIRCDSKLEYVCLDWFEKNHQVVRMGRSQAVILYEYEGKTRRFLPDFEIETLEETFLVEVKGTAPSQALNAKWADYEGKAPLKREALESYAEENGLTPFWFTKHQHRKFYCSLDSEELRRTA